jgi:hypothetical protein
MRLFFRLIILLVVVLPLAVIGLVYLAVDTQPSLNRAAEITPSNVERAKLILDQNDPRRLKPGARRTIVVAEGDLDLAANYLARQYFAGGARVDLRHGAIEVGASLRAPALPIYLNFASTLVEDGALPRIASLRVGRIPVPPWLAYAIIPRLFALTFNDADLRSFENVIKKVAIQDDRLALTYEWQADLPNKLRTALVSDEDRARLRAYQERLAAVSRTVKSQDVSLTALLVPLFKLAAERSGDPVAENRAAIFLLTLYVNGQNLAAILPEAKNWPLPLPRRTLLNGRDDFPKHFMVSAALAARAGGPLSDAVGVYKEIADSRGGSGFSFNDIAADRAGTRFGENAAESAAGRKLQQRMRAGVVEKDLMPATADLPEFMPEREFQRRFGGIDAPPYKKMISEIEARIAALALYR